MSIYAKDSLSLVNVKLKSTTDGTNGEVLHHNVDSCALPTGAATAAKQDDIMSTLTDASQVTTLSDGVDTVEIQTGAVDGAKGLRVFIGPTDPVSDLPVFVDFDHHQNHEGKAYQYVYYNATLNGTVDLRLVVPAYATAIRSPHMTIELICDTTSNLYLYEAPTVNAAGTEVTTIRNRNRIGTPNTPGMKIYTGTTYTSTGTELSHYITISAAKASISSDTSKAEWILKPSTEYLVRLTTAASSIVLIRLNWYEDLGV